MRKMQGILLGFCTVIMLSACGSKPAPTTAPTAALPTAELAELAEAAGPTEPTEPPTEEPGTGGGGVGTAGPGDVLFVRQGQVWAIVLDGSNERALTPTSFDSVIKDMTLSPSGQYLAFTLNNTDVVVVDLQGASMNTIDTSQPGSVGPLAWMPDSSALYYHKLVIDAATSAPSHSMLMLSAVPTEGGPNSVIDSDLQTQPVVHPGFALLNDILIQQLQPAAGDLGQWFIYNVQGATLTPVQNGYSVWDVSPDGTHLLLLNQADVLAGAGAPIPIYSATLDPAQGAVNPLQSSPVGETAAYTHPEYGPDNSAILSLRLDLSIPDQLTQLAHLATNDQGSYIVSVLSLPQSQNAVAFSWADANRAVLQGVPVTPPATDTAAATAEPAPSQLWVVTLDGSAPPTLLTTGDYPIVLPSP